MDEKFKKELDNNNQMKESQNIEKKQLIEVKFNLHRKYGS